LAEGVGLVTPSEFNNLQVRTAKKAVAYVALIRVIPQCDLGAMGNKATISFTAAGVANPFCSTRTIDPAS